MSCLCPHENHVKKGDDCEVLVVGTEGSGKSLLCRRLQALHARDPASQTAFSAYTVTTNGIQLTEVHCPKNSPFRTVLLREVGGQMSPLWPQYYEDCGMLIFVIDVSDVAALSTAAVELCETLQHPNVKGKPVCVALTKQDQPLVLSRQEVELVLHLHDLRRSNKASLTIIEVSAIPGAFSTAKGPAGAQMVVDSIEVLLDWVVEQKCLVLGLPVPGLSEAPLGMFTPKWATAGHV